MSATGKILKSGIGNFDDVEVVKQMVTVFDHLSDIYFWVKNRKSEFLTANQLFVEKCGFVDEQAIIGKTDYDLFPKDRANHYIEDDQLVIETGESILERVELAPEEEISLNHFITSKFPLRDKEGAIIGTIGIARDLDKTKQHINPYSELAGVVEHIHTHYNEQINSNDLARIAGMSPSLFERNFKNTFQMTPRQYVIDIRLTMACKMIINSRENLSYIAQECGFYDHSHFTRQFAKKFGITPKEYRNRHR